MSVALTGDLTPAEVSAYYAARVPHLPQRGRQWRGPCPIHQGKNDNFAVEAETGKWYCHSKCDRGGSLYDLEMELSNSTDFRTAANEVRRIVGRPAGNGTKAKGERVWGIPPWSHKYLHEQIERVESQNGWKHTAIYPYFRADSRLSYVKVRFTDKQNDKTFRQFALSSRGGWVPRKKAGKHPLLYRLHTLAAAEEVFIVNGEKAADHGAAKLGIVTTCAPDGEGKWSSRYAEALAGKRVRIVVDNDEKGAKHGQVVSEALASHVQEVKIIRLPNLPPKGDLWDWIETGGTREMLNEIVAKTPVFEPLPPMTEAQPAAESTQASTVGWHALLIPNKDGTPKGILANAITALRNAPEWNGVLAFNEFLLGTVALKRPPWDGAGVGVEWTDHEDRLTADWLQHGMIFVSTVTAGEAVQAVAKDRCFHPVREYLDTLEWDGTKRIDTWLTDYLGVERSEYAAAVGARWFISAVARIYKPGAKADCCLILEGPQGSKKSTALKTIAGEWFTDEIAELGSKDAALQTRGVWIIEIAELDSMSRADVSKIKAFMSRTCDRFRPPYGRRLIESPRQCVFAGSVNQSTYLRDETGGRRFWPVACKQIMIDELARDRDQLWAEAVVRYREGSVWWLDSVKLNRVAQEEQADRYEGDPWDDLIAEWLENPIRTLDIGSTIYSFTSDKESVSIHDVLLHAVGKRPEFWTQADKNRVGRSLRSLGWERYRDREGPRLEWRFRRVGE